ncbi:MAG TPA: PhzF family phenazine biosynthesis protein [Bacillales bacterium]
MTISVFQVDAFTQRPFTGNPAAVCVLPEIKSEKWMQHVAKEMNLSETAFLVKEKDGFHLRWFTPSVEVELCGHATLASAHLLWEKGYLSQNEQARFRTKSGLLTAERHNGWIELNFPAKPPTEVQPPEEVLKALDVDAKYTGQNQFDYLVEVHSEEVLRGIQPDFSLLKRAPVRGVIVTSQADASKDYDIVSRFFCPAVGVNEDPVTGSAHCCLGPYWTDKLGKSELAACQASERGGLLKLKVDGDHIYMSGQAVTVLEGNLL